VLVLGLVAGACGTGEGTRVDRIEVGMCFDDQDGAEVEHLPTVPCDEPHQNEVFHLYEVDGDEYPGQEALTADAERTCRGGAFRDYTGVPLERARFDVYQILPTSESWSRGDREVVCVLYDPDDNTETGSARVTAS
jgi:hypothetical protein